MLDLASLKARQADPSLVRASAVKPFTVTHDPFSLNVTVACLAASRERLERFYRYATRLTIALIRPFRHGTTHLHFTPKGLLVRLAGPVPKVRGKLTRYHAVVDQPSPWGSQIMSTVRETSPARVGEKPTGKGRCRHGQGQGADADEEIEQPLDTPPIPKTPLSWAEMLRRLFSIEITVFSHCGGRLRVIAELTY